jgi:hypothetical protein
MYNWISSRQQPMQSQPLFILKAHLPNGQIRRSKLYNFTTFEQLNNYLKNAHLNEDEKQHELVLTYRDERDDWISFDTEEELQDALDILRFEQTKNPLSALSVKIVLGEKIIEQPQEPAPVVEEIPVAKEEVEEKEEDAEQDAEQDDDEDEPIEQIPFDASFIVIDAQPKQEEIVDESLPPVEEEVEEEKEDAVEEEKVYVSDEELDEDSLRQSIQAMRQSMHTLMQSAPVLPEPAFEEKPQEPVVPPKYAQLEAQLRDMGFKDQTQNVELLEKHNGDIMAVINAQLETA